MGSVTLGQVKLNIQMKSYFLFSLTCLVSATSIFYIVQPILKRKNGAASIETSSGVSTPALRGISGANRAIDYASQGSSRASSASKLEEKSGPTAEMLRALELIEAGPETLSTAELVKLLIHLKGEELWEVTKQLQLAYFDDPDGWATSVKRIALDWSDVNPRDAVHFLDGLHDPKARLKNIATLHRFVLRRWADEDPQHLRQSLLADMDEHAMFSEQNAAILARIMQQERPEELDSWLEWLGDLDGETGDEYRIQSYFAISAVATPEKAGQFLEKMAKHAKNERVWPSLADVTVKQVEIDPAAALESAFSLTAAGANELVFLKVFDAIGDHHPDYGAELLSSDFVERFARAFEHHEATNITKEDLYDQALDQYIQSALPDDPLSALEATKAFYNRTKGAETQKNIEDLLWAHANELSRINRETEESPHSCSGIGCSHSSH